MTQSPAQGAMTGAMVYGAAGAFWAMWGASGLSEPTGLVVAVTGLVVGIVIVVTAAARRRHALPEPAPMTHSRAFRLTMLGEVVAILGGTALLAVLDLNAYMITWTAVVVGVHFVVFGRVFSARYHLIGALLIAAAVAGLGVDLAGAGNDVLVAVSGLLCALVLLGAGALLVAPRRPA